MITQEQLQTFSRTFQIDSYSVLREYLQLLFLKYFYELKESENVYFKGGTAIHFLYGSFRFSEDLDFTSLIDAEILGKLTQEVSRRLKGEFADVEITDLETRGQGLNQVLKYNAGLRMPLTIRLEFSLREKPLTKATTPIETTFPIASYPYVVHLDREELLAEKVRALLIRRKGRDLFDLWYLLSKGFVLKHKYVESKMKWYKKAFHFEELVFAVENFPQKALEEDLNKFLPKNYRPFIKELKIKTIEKLSVIKTETN